VVKRNQNIDRLIKGIRSIIKNRCSLSDEEVKLLNECIELLKSVKNEDSMHKKRSILSKAIGILIRIFSSDIHYLFDGFLN
jgi:hypothetical protein